MHRRHRPCAKQYHSNTFHFQRWLFQTWLEFLSLQWRLNFIIHFLLFSFHPQFSFHKQWFIFVTECHKLIYSLLWWLWAACSEAPSSINPFTDLGLLSIEVFRCIQFFFFFFFFCRLFIDWTVHPPPAVTFTHTDKGKGLGFGLRL